MWRNSTPTVPSLTAQRQSVAAAVQKLPLAVVQSGSTAGQTQSMVSRNDQPIDQFELSR